MVCEVRNAGDGSCLSKKKIEMLLMSTRHDVEPVCDDRRRHTKRREEIQEQTRRTLAKCGRRVVERRVVWRRRPKLACAKRKVVISQETIAPAASRLIAISVPAKKSKQWGTWRRFVAVGKERAGAHAQRLADPNGQEQGELV